MAADKPNKTHVVIRVLNKVDLTWTRVVLGEFRAVWSKPVTVGRDPRCTLVIDDPSVRQIAMVLSAASNHRYYSEVDDYDSYKPLGMRVDYLPFDLGGFELTIEETSEVGPGPYEGPVRAGESSYQVRDLYDSIDKPPTSPSDFVSTYNLERHQAHWLDRAAETRKPTVELQKALELQLGKVNERLAESGGFLASKPAVVLTRSLSNFVRSWAARWTETSPSELSYLRELDRMTRDVHRRAKRIAEADYSTIAMNCAEASAHCWNVDSHWNRVLAPTLARLGVMIEPPPKALSLHDLEFRIVQREARSDFVENVWHDLLEVWESGGWPAMLPSGNFIVFVEEDEASTMQIDDTQALSMLEDASRIIGACYFASPVLLWPILSS